MVAVASKGLQRGGNRGDMGGVCPRALGSFLDQQNVKVSMKLYKKLDKLVLYMSTRKSLKGWEIKFRDGLKR